MPLILAGGLAGCAETVTEEAAEAPVAEPTPEPMESAVVLNPNQAGEEELLALPQLDETLVAMILEERPFLSMTELAARLNESLSQEQQGELYVNLFVPMNLNTTPEKVTFSWFRAWVPGSLTQFEEYRPYQAIDQFRREIGKYVDEQEVARLEQYVFVPINLNTASDEEILAIPGVGERLLHEFKEYRPYQSMEQFRREIGKYVDEQEVARLEQYVMLE